MQDYTLGVKAKKLGPERDATQLKKGRHDKEGLKIILKKVADVSQTSSNLL